MTFTGRLSVEGLAELKEACVTVYGGIDVRGDCTVANGAELRMANCRNVKDWGRGGGVHIDNGALHVHGALEVHQSRTSGGGGGVYVFRASAQLLTSAPRLRGSSSLGEDESHRMHRRSRWRTWGWQVVRG